MKKLLPLFLICALLICTSCAGNKSSEDNGTAAFSEEEQFAADYLGAMSSTFKNPHSVKVYKAWYYEDSDGKRYVAYDLSATNDFGGEVEKFYGTKEGLKIDFSVGQSKASNWEEAIENYRIWFSSFGGDYWVESEYKTGFTAISDGKSIDANKVQQAFEENY